MTESEQPNENLVQRVTELETQNTNLSQQLQQALQNLQAATAAANAAANAATTATNRNNNQVLNMNVYNNDLFINNSEDKKLWLKATTDEPKILYDLSNKNFDTFQKFSHRGQKRRIIFVEDFRLNTIFDFYSNFYLIFFSVNYV